MDANSPKNVTSLEESSEVMPTNGPVPCWIKDITQRMGALPWWIVSATLHAVLLFLSMIIVVGSSRPPLTDIELVKVDLASPPPEKKKEEIKVELTKKAQVNLETKSDQVFYTPEKLEITDARVETENEVQSEMPARGQEDAISTIPAEGRGAIGFFGVGGGGKAGAFGWRTGGGRKQSAVKNGGSSESESTVDLGLEWLARHQEPEGYWDVGKWGAGRPPEVIQDNSEAISGLATLAFLGAGHTEKHGVYKDNVKRATAWLRSIQQPDGFLGRRRGSSADGYKHAAMGIALAESYGMAKNPQTGDAAQKAVDYSTIIHQHVTANGVYLAWRYSPKQYPDTSVTGWFVMQLKSAKVAGCTVPGNAFSGALNWFDLVQPLPQAGVPYDDVGKGRYQPDSNPAPRVTAIAMLCRQFLGFNPNHPVLMGGARYLLQNPPRVTEQATDYYYIYYGTLAMFQQGGNFWAQWNEWMRDPLIKLQTKDNTDDRGSWNPRSGYDKEFAQDGGRVYTTAMAILSLEVYYRYLPMYRE